MAPTAPSGSADKLISFLKTDTGQRLTIVVFTLLASAILWTFPGGYLAYVFGIPLLFFVPGFAVVRLFFWKGTSPEAKFVLSLGLSILVLIFLGLLLVLTIGLTEDTTRASVLIFAIGAVVFDVLWKRPEMAEKAETPEAARAPRTIKLDAVVVSMLGTAIAISVISLGLILTADYPSRTYFAVTDENGSADINTTLLINSTFNLTIHMKNGEDGPCKFTMFAHNESLLYYEEFSRTLEKGEIWLHNVSIPMTYYGEYRIDFDLYIEEEGSPAYFYGNLHLWIQVVDSVP